MNNKELYIHSLSPDIAQNIQLKLQTQRTRQRFIRIEIIDTDNNIINEVSGSAVGGNYNIDSASAIRRTCSVTFELEKGYLPSSISPFWINKRFKLFIGLKDFETDIIYWFNKGEYAIQDPNISISVEDKNITINGLDKMALHNGDISGQLDYSLVITPTIKSDNEDEQSVYLQDAIKAVMKDSGETALSIATTNLTIPYKIESSIGETRWDMIEKLTTLFYNYQAYYNENGVFVFDKKPNYQSNNNIVNDIKMNFSQDYKNNKLQTIPYNLLINISRDVLYSNIKNKIVVFGGVQDDGFQPKFTVIVDNKNYPNSPYTVEKLDEKNTDGSIIYRTLIITDDTYVDAEKNTKHLYATELCKKRAEQEVYLHQQATDTVHITCLPIYSLDVNDVIFLNDSESGAIGEYVVTNISCGLGTGDTMTINANKLW